MAAVLEITESEPATLDEFLDHVRRTVDPDDVDSLAACAPALARLSRDRTFLARALVGQLRHITRFQDANPYVPTSFLLDRGDRYVVRANLWRPLTAAEDEHRVGKLYTYGTGHDHDFSLLTAGYWGPGYETITSTYDCRTVEGFAGEHVELTPLERETLAPGKLMLYVASRDLHVQLPPQAFSISLNVITWPKRPLPQYLFDLDAGTVVSRLENGYSTVVSIFDIAATIGDWTTHDALDAIAQTHGSLAVRASAGAAQQRLRERFAGAR